MKTLIFLPPETSSTPPSSFAKSRSTSVDIIRAPTSSAVLDLSQTNAFCRLNRGLVDGIAEVLNRKKDGEEIDTELTRTDITKEGVDWVSINRLRQMALSGITLLDNLDVKNPDQSIKVRILKTWTQPDKYNPGETLKIEMILMDEQGVMIEAVCNKKYLIKFQKLLKEGDCFIIRKPSLGDNMDPYKILNHPYKVHLNWGSTVVKCMDFRGTQYGFSFSPFEQLIQNSVADNTILGKGRIIYVTLWDSYADKFSEYMVDKEPDVEWYYLACKVCSRKASRKWIIGEPDDEAHDSKNQLSLHLPQHHHDWGGPRAALWWPNDGCNMVEWPWLLRPSLIRTPLIRHSPSPQLHSLLPHSPFIFIRRPPPLRPVTFAGAHSPASLEPSSFASQAPIRPGPNPIRALAIRQPRPSIRHFMSFGQHHQPSTRKPYSATLFGNDNFSPTIISKPKFTDGEYNNLHPDEFNLLLDRKFAFKIDISRFNLRNNVHSNMKFFGVSRITDDASVLSTLENKYKYEEGSNTKVMHATSVDFSSQEIANSKDSVSFTGDNSTPFSENVATTARTVHRNGNSQHSFTDGLKRNLEDAYDVDDSPCQSVSKSRKKLIEDDESDAVFTRKLLAPKIEK
ncbi:hypothetical protein E3N88_02157 [Mikania micrantha]|uniref:Replication protein A 70 kDa DNA-binding subunit B/D first OB fold domain-containing protein n=1 Tax=Mikania micrantha TaxID=192012 RepID=A0A5N6Q4Z3_9ASTR|nr:hypothetical protein E3N88_02157 [Mikania micrantha]